MFILRQNCSEILTIKVAVCPQHWQLQESQPLQCPQVCLFYRVEMFGNDPNKHKLLS